MIMSERSRHDFGDLDIDLALPPRCCLPSVRVSGRHRRSIVLVEQRRASRQELLRNHQRIFPGSRRNAEQKRGNEKCSDHVQNLSLVSV